MIQFGPFQLDPGRRVLNRDGAPLPLEGRALDLLIHLALQIGQVIGKHALIAAVWPGRTVEENNLSVHISALRRLLGTDADGRSLIQTVPGRGYMLVDAAGPDAAPAPRPAPFVLQSAGPVRPMNSFVGRVQECADLLALLASNPLVTVTAAGGMGKTRLAHHVAAHHVTAGRADAYPDGLHVAELSAITDPAHAADHVAALFPLGNAEGPASARITAFLRTRRLLLVLDNCEHVLDPIAAIAAAILAQCPHVTILATSREALGVPGERLFRLPPLTIPPPTTQAPDQALAFDAIRLFVERATAAVPGFVFDAAAVAPVIAICTHLDGIALAIEMAVPRLRILPPTQLAHRLHESLRLLAAPDRHAVPRHRTLRAVMDWSYALLDAEAARLMRCLAVFAGAVDIEAVMAVAAEGPGSPELELDLLERLTGLVDKSLVVADTSAGQARYRLLETVRQYMRDRMAEDPGPEPEATLRRRHARHWATVFDAASTAWPTTPTQDWLPPIAAAIDELRAALTWCFAAGGVAGDVALGLRLAAASTPAWWELPNLPLREARIWFDRAVAHITPKTPPLVAARVWFGHSWRDMRQGDTANLPSAERAVALFQQTDDQQGLGAALWRAGSAALVRETADRAAETLDEAERVLRRVAPGKWLSLCLIRQGDLRMRAGQNAAALAAYEEALDLARRTGHWYALTNGGSNRADLLFQLDRREEALDQLRTLRAELPLGPRTPLTSKLAAHLVVSGHDAEAAEALTEVIDHALAIGYGAAFARGLESLAVLRAEAGDLDAAARLAGYARTTLPPAARWGAPRAVFDRLEAILDRTIPHEDRARRLAQGAAWDEPTAETRARAALADQMRHSLQNS